LGNPESGLGGAGETQTSIFEEGMKSLGIEEKVRIEAKD
jgi:hypothetical protein